MEVKSWKAFHKDLRWSTRIYTLMAILVILFSVLFDAWSTNWALTIVSVIAAILFVETFAYAFSHHPVAMRTLRWILILILFAMLLMGHYL